MEQTPLMRDEANDPLIMGQRFDVALNNINQGVCFFNGQRRLILANRRYAEIYDLSVDSIRPGATLKEIVALRYAAGSFPDMSPEDYLRWRDRIQVSSEPSDSIVTLKNG